MIAPVTRIAHVVAAAVLLLAAAPVVGQPVEEVPVDPRYNGYADNQSVQFAEPGSYTTAYFILAGLGFVTTVVMFKNAKRTHLD
jgi:hypothetical protein